MPTPLSLDENDSSVPSSSPTTTFASLGIPADLVSRLAARGIESPFPIQAATIPDAMAGRDICGRAPTGSGKTIAFGIPMITRLSEAPRPKGRRPRGLVLVPTRELAAQVHQELLALTPPNGLWIDVIYGGVGFDRQIKNARAGTDILVACPGRLADLINQGYVKLSDVELIVIDEADRMADMGFLPEVRRLLDQCADERQTLLFSATLDGDVNKLIKQYQHDPARHELDVDERVDARADHHFWSIDTHGRVTLAADVIKRVGPTVVFTRTKHGADRVAKQLDREGVAAAAIHGGRSQSQRDRALDQFHRGEVSTLVATDVAARGIHVDGVAAVVHFDPPQDHKDYVHRSGRTARAGAGGVVVSLVTPDMKSKVSGLQKALKLPKGTTSADVKALPEGEARVYRPRAESTRTNRPSSGSGAGSSRSGRSGGRRDERARNDKPRDDRPRNDKPRRESAARPERGDRTDRPHAEARPERFERSDRPARAVRPEHAGSSTNAWDRRSERGPAERSGRDGADRRPARETDEDASNRKARRAHLQRDDRGSSAPAPFASSPAGGAPSGKDRPSGSARRKAKKQAAAEREALGLPPLESPTWEDKPAGSAPKSGGKKRIKAKPNAKAKARTSRAAEESAAGRRKPKVRTAAGRAPSGSGGGRPKAASRQGPKAGARRSD